MSVCVSDRRRCSNGSTARRMKERKRERERKRRLRAPRLSCALFSSSFFMYRGQGLRRLCACQTRHSQFCLLRMIVNKKVTPFFSSLFVFICLYWSAQCRIHAEKRGFFFITVELMMLMEWVKKISVRRKENRYDWACVVCECVYLLRDWRLVLAVKAKDNSSYRGITRNGRPGKTDYFLTESGEGESVVCSR